RHSGAFCFVAKPIKTKDVLDDLLDNLTDFVSRKSKSLLLLEPSDVRRDRILETIDGSDIQVTTVPDGASALQMLHERRIDCMVVDADLPDMPAAEFADQLEGAVNSNLSVIVYADEETADEDQGWKTLAQSYTLRRVHSPERLLDQTAYFLHRNIAKLPEDKRLILENLHQSNKVLAGKKVLIVDDDIRNIFALSTVLEEHEMVTVSAETGRDAIRILQT